MKYIKKFENINEPQSGDYIVSNFEYQPDLEWSDYINSKVGLILGLSSISPEQFKVLYEIDDSIIQKFEPSDKEHIKIIDNKKTIVMYFKKSEIKFFSPDKEIAEAYLASKQYNL